ncbi:hypothetical protein CAPTEDRAFT_216814 [Capitella teleta]|uniref:Uncharacterized protein n=1 Tax=Capitella teleta TaxID=283909 RepID=R7UYW4_CAPTE|nr:hypothetical protein CAPTEDRAFT_216814 [Capitella teleta]|eukprot:ELU09127.1 hypothetical protein CAPTEDRAFT_216814 [Capitella teleta]
MAKLTLAAVRTLIIEQTKTLMDELKGLQGRPVAAPDPGNTVICRCCWTPSEFPSLAANADLNEVNNYLKEAPPTNNKPACRPSKDAGRCQTSRPHTATEHHEFADQPQ